MPADALPLVQAWVVAFRKLAIRYDRHGATVLAFLHLACTLICLRYVAHGEADGVLRPSAG